jgi:hypothetical protein
VIVKLALIKDECQQSRSYMYRYGFETTAGEI